MNFFTTLNLPDKEFLSSISYKTSLGFSLKKSLSKVDKSLLIRDLLNYIEYSSFVDILDFKYRIKSIDSCLIKYKKNLNKGNSISSSFNDVIGLRIIVDNYPNTFPDYFRVVDMSQGKRVDDGYRGVHLYFQLDNHHYPIEVQLNSKRDRVFADWCHKYSYKTLGSKISLHLREEFDKGVINSEEDFIKEIQNYEQ